MGLAGEFSAESGSYFSPFLRFNPVRPEKLFPITKERFCLLEDNDFPRSSSLRYLSWSSYDERRLEKLELGVFLSSFRKDRSFFELLPESAVRFTG